MSIERSALVEPAGPLSPEEVERYSRHILLPELGELGQRRLANARVLVIGAGGLGSPVLLYLAAAGVGTLGVVDDDHVDVGNLQRQVVHGVADVGAPKLESARAAIAALNPLVDVRLHNTRLDAGNAIELFADYDVVVDGSDNFATRYLASDAAAILGTPHVWGAVSQFEGQLSVFWNEHGPVYRDLYPEPPAPSSVLSCGEGGVLGALCGVIGSMMAGEVVKLVTGIGETLLGRVAFFSALTSSWRELSLQRDADAAPISTLVDYDAFCATGSAPAPSRGERGGGDIREQDGDAAHGDAADADGLTVQQLAALLERRAKGEAEFELIDVREQAEHELVSIPGSRVIPVRQIVGVGAGAGAGRVLPQLSLQTPIVLYCKVGVRSAQALAELRRNGFTRVRHVTGGVLAWVEQIEPDKPGY